MISELVFLKQLYVFIVSLLCADIQTFYVIHVKKKKQEESSRPAPELEEEVCGIPALS